MIEQTLIIPLRNEENRIGNLFARLRSWSLFQQTEVLFIDDGSTDTTVNMVRLFLEQENHPAARLIALGSHEGKGAAVRRGMLAAGGHRITFTDADLPFGIGGVEKCFAALKTGADVAVGARDLIDSSVAAAHPGRQLMSTVFQTWVKMVSRTGDVVDTQCGLKGFSQEAAHLLFADLRCRGLAFDIEILEKACRCGLRVDKLPVTLQPGEGSSFSALWAAPKLLVSAPFAAWHGRKRSNQPPGSFLMNTVVAALFFFIVLLPLWDNFHLDGGRDWDQFQADLLSARHAILAEGELPFWMPYRAGGHDALADPQSMWFSPLGLLVLIFDFPVGARLFIALCVAMGAIGALRLGELLGFGRPGQLLLAAILFLSSPAALYTAGGIPQFVLGLALLPWLVFLCAKGTRPSILAGGVLLGLDLYNGDINHFIYHALFLFLLSVAYAIFKRSWKPIVAVILLGVTAFIISAPKFVPASLFAYHNPRSIGSLGTGFTPELLTHALLNKHAIPHLQFPKKEFMALTPSGELVPVIAPVQNRALVPGTFIDWVNGGAYVGGGTLALAGCGFFLLLYLKWRPPDLARDERMMAAPDSTDRITPYRATVPDTALMLALTGVALIFLWLSFGNNVAPSAWGALQKLPIFSALRSPPRLIIYFLICLAILAALALEKGCAFMARRTGHSRASAIGLLVVALIAADMHLASRLAFTLAFCEPPVPGISQDATFQQLYAPMPPNRTWYGPPVTPYVRANKGLVNGYCAVPVLRAARPANTIGYEGEVSFGDDGHGTLLNYKFTARRVEIEYETPRATKLVINQNWSAGWHPSIPDNLQVARHQDSRLAVWVPAGRHRIVLRYAPPGLAWGLFILLVGLPALLYTTTRLKSLP